MSEQESTVKEVEALEREVGNAIAKRDAGFLDRVIADDFIATNPFGQVMTKQEAISTVSSPDYKLESLTNDHIEVRLFGDVALATALGTATGTYRGKIVTGRFSYLRAWVKRDGEWRAVAAQATNLPEQPSATSGTAQSNSGSTAANLRS
jgi:ketosteroid isomerase-like protein